MEIEKLVWDIWLWQGTYIYEKCLKLASFSGILWIFSRKYAESLAAHACIAVWNDTLSACTIQDAFAWVLKEMENIATSSNTHVRVIYPNAITSL